ncbi:hypothetical protein RN001_004225 [Aquatica leii]|uniref:Uncharacterized protein n=1 Tax=Aquatica leii TaxID=1421715 RepID=A0AAN7SA04_9COLE|nr:hypothetical protein RN001_004225 [Aquatica leii]
MSYLRACAIFLLLSFVTVNALHTQVYKTNFHQAHPIALVHPTKLRISSNTNEDNAAGYDHERAYRSRQNKKEDNAKVNEKHENERNDSENGEKRYKNVDNNARYKKYKDSESSRKSSKFNEKKGHKRGHKSRGYHNKFIRDEIIREHKFYDNAYKSGNYEKHGDHNVNYESKSGWRKKDHNKTK